MKRRHLELIGYRVVREPRWNFDYFFRIRGKERKRSTSRVLSVLHDPKDSSDK